MMEQDRKVAQLTERDVPTDFAFSRPLYPLSSRCSSLPFFLDLQRTQLQLQMALLLCSYRLQQAIGTS
jgi:hypothetical protein